MWFKLIICGCFVLCCVRFSTQNALKDPFICGMPSCIPSENFKYKEDIIYKYEYTTNINTWFAGSSNNQSTLSLECEVSVHFFKPCEGVLELSDVKLRDQDEKFPQERAELFANAVQEYPLRFAFHDGAVTEICGETGDEEWSLNFKRGILSLFQNTMKRFDVDFAAIEADVQGTCETDYKVTGLNNTSLIVIKSRDLNKCTDRYKYLSILQTVRYNFQSEYQTWPVLKSESRCQIAIDHNIYKGVHCKERHAFVPFSGKNSGAVTTLEQVLYLKRELNASDVPVESEKGPISWTEIKHRASLLYHHENVPKRSTGELKAARDLLKKLCKLEQTQKERDTPKSDTTASSSLDDGGSTVTTWAELVRVSRALTYHELNLLHSRSSALCVNAPKYLIDALPYIATVGSVELIKEMILKNDADSFTKEEWLMSMAIIPRPKREMLLSMKELLESAPTDKLISFAASSMLHSYCRNSKLTLRECCGERQNVEIIAILERNIKEVMERSSVNLTREDREKMTVSIKSLGNIGGFKKELYDVLSQIIEDPYLPTSLRLTAIDAFRKTPCIETREYFLHIFREDFVDIEVRLASYLQVMKCPNLATIRKIIHALNHEPVKQASSFVWSHLTNLGKSSIPSRVEIQGLLSGGNLPNYEKEPDFRTFSRNYENSLFFDQFNAGGNYEANLIFSPDSYIPRSLSLNLTVDMFGESINFLELKARGEGFEKYFETIFGENGPLSKENIIDRIQHFRDSRSLSDADQVRRKIDKLHYDNKVLEHRYPLADIGLKVFGNEIFYWSGQGDDEIRSGLSKLNPLYHINRILSGKEISYKKSSLFLDTTYAVPTGSGFPLNMNLLGTSFINLRLAGSLSGAENFFTTKSLDFQGKIHPSLAVNVQATMGVYAGGYSSTGIRLNLRAYTVTASEIKLKLRGTRLVEMDLSLPYTEQEIFAAKSDLIILHGDKEYRQSGLNTNRVEQNTCSWSTFDKAVGLKICANYEFPNMEGIHNAPYFIMSGPAKYVVSLEKVDRSAKRYSLRYRWDTNKTDNFITFTFHTPDSKEKRMINASLVSFNDSGTAEMVFQSAENMLSAHATYKNKEEERHIKCVLDIDGKKHFDLLIALSRQPLRNGYVQYPEFHIVVNNEKIAEMTGALKTIEKKGVSQCDVQLEFQTKKLASRLIGYVTWNGPSKGAKLKLDYRFLNEKKQSVLIEGVLSEVKSNGRIQLYTELGLKFTNYPHYDVFGQCKYLSSPTHIDTSLNISSTKELVSSDPKLRFKFVSHKRTDSVLLDTRFELHRPEFAFGLKYSQLGAQYTSMAVLSYDPNAEDISLSASLYFPAGTDFYVDGAVNITLPTMHPFTSKIWIYEQSTHDYEIKISYVWFTGIDVNIEAIYQDLSRTNVALHKLKAVVTGSQFKDITGEARYTQDNRQINVVAQGEYESEKYGAMVSYVVLSEANFTANAYIDYKGKLYRLNVIADLQNNTNLVADLHLDQARDIHIVYQKWLTADLKRLKASINWDANRDPDQKLSFETRLKTRERFSYEGDVTIYYPGRRLHSEFDFLFRDWFCKWLIRIGWSPQDIISWRVKLYSEAQKETIYALESGMITPFVGWKDTGLDLLWRYEENLRAVNGSVRWEKDFIAFDMLADYMFRKEEIFGEIRAVINSTVATLPKAAAIARHRHSWAKYSDTLLTFQYNNDGLLMINSSWQLDKYSTFSNVSGRVAIKSPFQGYKKCLLKTKFVFGDKRDVQGKSYLDLEDKAYTINVDGYLQRITNCMLIVNVTSPVQELVVMSAKFGFVERDRHLVALVTSTNASAGIEVLLRLNTSSDFDILLHVAAPIRAFSSALVKAKRGDDQLTFRINWDKIDLGITGIWHYKSMANFNYEYKIYTPLDGFEENGIVLKNVFGAGLDTEFSIKVSKHKFGIAVLMRDTGKGMIEVLTEKIKGVQRQDVFLENFWTNTFITLDTLYYPTVKFSALTYKFIGVDEEEIIKAVASLNLPNGAVITLTDTFSMENYLSMKNALEVMTPFVRLKEIRSNFYMDIDVGNKYNVSLSVLVSNTTQWFEASAKIYYETEIGEEDEFTSHIAALSIVTPLKTLSKIDSIVKVYSEEALTRVGGEVLMDDFRLELGGKVEMDEYLFDASGSVNLTSPHLDCYSLALNFKKEFSDIENFVSGGLALQQGDEHSYFDTELVWQPSMNMIKLRADASVKPSLPELGLKVHYIYEKELEQRVLITGLTLGQKYYDLNALQEHKKAKIVIKSPHKGFNNVLIDMDNMDGTVSTDNDEYTVHGEGQFSLTDMKPNKITFVLTSKKTGQKQTVNLSSDRSDTKHSIEMVWNGPISYTSTFNTEFTNDTFDFGFKVLPSNPKLGVTSFNAHMDYAIGSKYDLKLKGTTPLPDWKEVQANAGVVLENKNGLVDFGYSFPKMNGAIDGSWSNAPGDIFLKVGANSVNPSKNRFLALNVFLGNRSEAKTHIEHFAGFYFDIDRVWRLSSNGSFDYKQDESVTFQANTELPKPNLDVHTLNFVGKKVDSNGVAVSVNYLTDVSMVQAGVDGIYKMKINDLDANLTMYWGVANNVSRVDNKLLSNILDNDTAISLYYLLETPLYVGVETFKVNGTYKKDLDEGFQYLIGKCHSPGDKRLADLNIKYGGLRRTLADFNVTTPFKPMPWLKSHMNISNSDINSLNLVELFWPNKYATLSTRRDVTILNDGAKETGNISIQLPFKANHSVLVDYALDKGDLLMNGDANLYFDSEKIVHGSFNTLTEVKPTSTNVSSTDVKIENKLLPLGVKYSHEYDKDGAIDIKQATVFHLTNSTRFNMSGILDVYTSDTGKNISFTAIHSNRTFKLSNNYEALEHDLYQGSRIDWSPDVWFSYDLHMENMSTVDNERQRLTAKVLYPRRYLNAVGEYSILETELSGLAKLVWNLKGEEKSTEVRGRWIEPSTQDQKVELALSHPSFRKDVTLKGRFTSNPEVMLNMSINLQYSDFENEHLNLNSYIRDYSDGPNRNYKFVLQCAHPATSLDLDINSNLNVKSRWYSYHNYYKYQKSLFYQTLRDNKGLLDFNNNTVQYERNNETDRYRLNGTWDLNYPLFVTKLDVNRTTGSDIGIFVLSINDKIVYGHYNSSDDISYHLVGKINDARSAQLNIWRDFDDVTTTDVSSYVRLNHSKLLTSSVLWRPEIFQQIRGQIVYVVKAVYKQLNETLTIVKEAPLESHTALKNVWNDATPRIRDFLEDLNDLHVLKDDLDQFQHFLNESYESNDFYIKDIVDVSYNILQQMALDNKLENLPALLKDAWSMMGNTTESIKNSIMWVIETIKNGYNNFINSLNRVLESDLMEQASLLMESAVVKYDSFIRDVHYKFVTYWEVTWTNAYSKMIATWTGFLKSMEPTFIKFIHYLEQIAWKVGTETMDFFHQRTNELTESPYFNYLANLGQDFDRFWKDMHTNDAITNIKKYTKLAWDAFYTKVIEKLPFRKELQDIWNDIINGVKQLGELSLVKYIKDKFWEAKNRLSWWYEYFRINEALIKAWEVIYAKIVEIPHTALQYEEIHRTPKTMFIFDPRKGKISLEQKLPMSWHAFNRTPEFTEIVEYKIVHDFVNDWIFSNKSIWSFYYDLKPYLDSENVLPPFSGIAIMTGQGTVVTFDRKLFTVSEPGTFLLGKDYNRNNFTILMESNSQGRYDFVVLTKRNIIKIDLYREQVTIGNKVALTLPVIVDDYELNRENDLLKIHSKNRIDIECNFLYKTCKLELSGWYYGDPGGLFGTFNNEIYDDMQLTNNSYTDSIVHLSRSWNLERDAQYYAPIDNKDTLNSSICEKFFKNKVSPLQNCFGIVDPDEFMLECQKGIDPCSLASIYTDLCSKDHIAVNIPEKCVQCTSPQGDVIEEGDFFQLPYIPNSTDVIFLIEAQYCNVNMRKSKNIDVFIDALETKLNMNGIKDNRYGIVSFGGTGIYNQAKALYVNNKFFTDSKEIQTYFDHVYIEKRDMHLNDSTYDADMFGALSFASNMPFRPGTSRTFVMFPCTRCDLLNMKLDYSVVYQVIMDTSVTLHIVMDEEFSLDKKRIVKTLFGVDSERAYTVKDSRQLVGDVELRKQVKLPKAKLGFCTSLALESNGTVFTAKKLELERAAARRFSNVFATRVAQSAFPCSTRNTKCECRESRLYCRPCMLRRRMSISDLSDLWNSSEVDDLIDSLFDFNKLNIY